MNELPSFHDRIREELLTVPGVVRALVEGPPWVVFLVCDPAAALQPVESAAAALLARTGIDHGTVTIHPAFLTSPAPRRRIRLVGARLHHPVTGTAAATVTLEWAETLHSGEATGEGGTGGNLRVCALATMNALERIVPGLPSVQLVGIRSVRVFDRDLLVVLLRSRGAVEQSLLGSTLAVDDMPVAVARAVLSALNRTLGNYLSVGD